MVSDSDTYVRASRVIHISYLCMGFPFGVLMPRLAEIKSAVGANAASFGSALALMSIGTLAGTWLAARLIHSFGSRAAARALFVFVVLASAANGYISSIVWFGAVTILAGAANTAVMMAMNSQSVLIEQHLRRSFLPKVLGSWSIGTFVGSSVSAIAAPYVSPAAALTTTAVVVLAAFMTSVHWLLPAHLDDRPHDDPSQLPRHERIPRPIRNFLVLVAVAQSLGLIAEMSVGDWGSVLLREHFGVAVGPNGYGFAVFTFTMILVRLNAARWIDRFGLERVIRSAAIGGSFAFAALLTVANIVGSSSPMRALLAMCLAYASLAVGVGAMPAAFISAAGAIRGLPSARAIAVTTAVVAIGNMLLRAAFGALAEVVSLPYALYAIPVMVVAAGLMAALLRADRLAEYVVRPTASGSH